MEEITEVSVIDANVIEAQTKAEIDAQVATAKKYPRNLMNIKNNVLALVTMDLETAQSCSYSLPRSGKDIEGPTIHLAKMLAQQYGNMRASAKVTEVGATSITCQAFAHDLESNTAIGIEVKRKILDKKGKRYNDDLITMTGNAGNAIALRNAILAVIPKSLTNAAYNEAKKFAVSDITDEKQLATKRKEMLDVLKNKYKVEPEQVLNVLRVKSVSDITKEGIATIRGIYQAIVDGDTTAEQAFPKTSKQNNSNKANAAIYALKK